MTYGKPSEMPKESTETSWSLVNTALTPEACGSGEEEKGGESGVEACGPAQRTQLDPTHQLMLLLGPDDPQLMARPEHHISLIYTPLFVQ
ncbi:unnamed protein product [Merluccius merluccius]